MIERTLKFVRQGQRPAGELNDAKPDHSLEPRVAVLMAVCNGLPWLNEQIKSILGQQSVKPTIFISIDPSTDGTEDYCRQLANENPQIVTLDGPGPGSPAGNFYRLITEVSVNNYDYIALADQDDIWLADKLSHAVDYLRRHSAHGYSSSVTAFWPDSRQCLVRKDYPQRQWDFLFESPGPGCSFVLTPDLIQQIRDNLTSEGVESARLNFHDVYIYALARVKGYRWVIDSESRLLYRQHPGNTVGANRGLKAALFRLGVILRDGLDQPLQMADAIGVGESNFVRRWRNRDRLSLCFLLINGWQCRRKVKDRVFFVLILAWMCLFYSPPRNNSIKAVGPDTGRVN